MSLSVRSSKTWHVEKTVDHAAAGQRLTFAHWFWRGGLSFDLNSSNDGDLFIVWDTMWDWAFACMKGAHSGTTRRKQSPSPARIATSWSDTSQLSS